MAHQPVPRAACFGNYCHYLPQKPTEIAILKFSNSILEWNLNRSLTNIPIPRTVRGLLLPVYSKDLTVKSEDRTPKFFFSVKKS